MAQSSRNCGERAQVVQRLVEGYGETRRSLGPGANNTIIEVFASVGTGMCLIADSNIAMSRTESPATQSFHTV